MEPTQEPRRERFNVSRWALEHAPLTRYLMVVLMVLGLFAYFQLGQDEDPPFTFRAMVIRTYWPGATAEQVAAARAGLAASVTGAGPADASTRAGMGRDEGPADTDGAAALGRATSAGPAAEAEVSGTRAGAETPDRAAPDG